MYVRRMRDRIVRLLRSPRVQGAGDAVLAAVLAFTSVVPVLGGDPSWGKPKALGVALGLLSTVPIAWRSRYPLSVAAIVLAANGACIYAAAPHQAAFQPFLALVLAGYSAGSRAEGRRALWVPAVMAVLAIPLFWAAVRHGQDPGNAIPSYVWLVAAWAAGRTGRSWRLKSTALERANRELAEQRELQAQAAVAVERGRIARELHDTIAHAVSVMVLQVGAVRHQLPDAHQEHKNVLRDVEQTGRTALTDMRHLLDAMREDDGGVELAPQPGLDRLDGLLKEFGRAGLPVRLSIAGEQFPLPGGVDISAYRIVQEGLTNVLKHAQATEAEVALDYAPDQLSIEVRDNGGGAGHGNGSGHGLVGIRERVRLYDGEMTAGTQADGGFLLRARLSLTRRLL